MTFLNPWAFGFGGLVPVIVLLYLLKVKRRPIAVSTLMFWQRVLQENRRRALFQRLRQLFSLLLHLLIFALVLLAMSHPALDRIVREGSSTVLIVDSRLRMQGVEADGRTRFAKAVEAAKAMVRQAGPLRQTALLTLGGSPSVGVPFTGDEKALREKLLSLHPTDAGGNLDGAIQLAHELLASRAGERRIVILTDRPPAAESAATAPAETPAIPAPSKAATPTIPIEYVSVATPRDNVAITRFAARPLPETPDTAEILLRIKNFGAASASGRVEVLLDGQTVDVRPFDLPAGEQMERVFPVAPPAIHNRVQRNGWLVAKLDTHDALAVDDTAFATLPIHPPVRVLLITKEDWFLEKLLAADPSLHFELLTPDSFTPDVGAKFDVVVLDGFLPPQLDLTKAAGNYLFIGQTPFNSEAPAVEQPLFTDAEAGDPLLRGVNLEHIALSRSAAMAIPAEADGWKWRAPLRFAEHPLLIAGTRPVGAQSQRVVALGFRIGDSDLPLRVAFPLLIVNSLHWLAQDRLDEMPAAAAGEIVPLEAGEIVRTPPERPGLAPTTTAAKSYEGSFQPERQGLYRVDRGKAVAWLAVNAASDAESDLRTGVGTVASNGASPFVALGSLSGWPLSLYLMLAALGLFTGEWWLFHRRRTE